ncbi:MAG: hypothetical protein QW568_05220 [Candidatus Anstonellaceae archaeon]
MKKALAVLFVAFLFSLAFTASSPLSTTKAAMREFCNGLRAVLPVAAMLMVVVAGGIYASGQAMGAETRARANVWATAALVGALVAVLIWAIAPPVLSMVYIGVAYDTNAIANAVC